MHLIKLSEYALLRRESRLHFKLGAQRMPERLMTYVEPRQRGKRGFEANVLTSIVEI